MTVRGYRNRGRKITVMQQRLTEQRLTVDSRRRQTNFKTS